MGFFSTMFAGLGGLFAGLMLTAPKPKSVAEATGDISQNTEQDSTAVCAASQVVDISGMSISIGNIDCKGDVTIGKVTSKQNASCKVTQTQAAAAKATIDAAAESKNGADALTGGDSTAISEANLQQSIEQRMQSACTAHQETRLNNWNLNIQSIKSAGSCDIASTSVTQQFACVLDQAQKASEDGKLSLKAVSTVTGTSWAGALVFALIIAVVLVFLFMRHQMKSHTGGHVGGMAAIGPLKALSNITNTYKAVVNAHPNLAARQEQATMPLPQAAPAPSSAAPVSASAPAPVDAPGSDAFDEA
jgi:hypothetical protein